MKNRDGICPSVNRSQRPSEQELHSKSQCQVTERPSISQVRNFSGQETKQDNNPENIQDSIQDSIQDNTQEKHTRKAYKKSIQEKHTRKAHKKHTRKAYKIRQVLDYLSLMMYISRESEVDSVEGYVPPFSINNQMLMLAAQIAEKTGKISSDHSFETRPHLQRSVTITSICFSGMNSFSLIS